MEGGGRQTRFFHDRREAAGFAGTLTLTATIRRSNLEDVFVEMTGRKVID
jgi:ABC-2 type transport system ATP-binding protein